MHKMYVYVTLLSVEQFTTTMKHLSYLNNDPIKEKKVVCTLCTRARRYNHSQPDFAQNTLIFRKVTLYSTPKYQTIN